MLRQTMAAGGYGSDELAVRIVREFIGALPADVPGVILDGFPRDRAQLDAWLAFPADHGIAVVVDTPEDICRERVNGRMVCDDCGWTGPPSGDHLRALRRSGSSDAPTMSTTAAFERRLHDYESRVAPIIEAWDNAGLPLLRLDGTKQADELAEDLLALLPEPVAVADPAPLAPRDEMTATDPVRDDGTHVRPRSILDSPRRPVYEAGAGGAPTRSQDQPLDVVRVPAAGRPGAERHVPALRHRSLAEARAYLANTRSWAVGCGSAPRRC